MFTCHSWWEDATGTQWVENRDAVKQHKGSLKDRVIWTKMSVVPRLKTLSSMMKPRSEVETVLVFGLTPILSLWSGGQYTL